MCVEAQTLLTLASLFTHAYARVKQQTPIDFLMTHAHAREKQKISNRMWTVRRNAGVGVQHVLPRHAHIVEPELACDTSRKNQMQSNPKQGRWYGAERQSPIGISALWGDRAGKN